MKFTNILYGSIKDHNGKYYFENSNTRTIDKSLQIKKITDFKKQLKKSFDVYFGLRGRDSYIEFLKNEEYRRASFAVLEDIEKAIEETNFKREELEQELRKTRRDLKHLISAIKEGVVDTLDGIRVYDFYKRCGDDINRRAIVLLDEKLEQIK